MNNKKKTHSNTIQHNNSTLSISLYLSIASPAKLPTLSLDYRERRLSTVYNLSIVAISLSLSLSSATRSDSRYQISITSRVREVKASYTHASDQLQSLFLLLLLLQRPSFTFSLYLSQKNVVYVSQCAIEKDLTRVVKTACNHFNRGQFLTHLYFPSHKQLTGSHR